MWPFSSSSPPSSSSSASSPSPVASSSSSSSGSSSEPLNPSTPNAAPNREQRAKCWQARDAYFDCLMKNGIATPGQEPEGVCNVEVGEYEKNCGKTWIDHFNQRKATELRQKASLGFRPSSSSR